MTASSQVKTMFGRLTSSRAVALGVRRVRVQPDPCASVCPGQTLAATAVDVPGSPGTRHNCNHNCNHADSAIVRWYAEHYCHGDVLVARREVARWTAAEAHRWLRLTGQQGSLTTVVPRV